MGIVEGDRHIIQKDTYRYIQAEGLLLTVPPETDSQRSAVGLTIWVLERTVKQVLRQEISPFHSICLQWSMVSSELHFIVPLSDDFRCFIVGFLTNSWLTWLHHNVALYYQVLPQGGTAYATRSRWKYCGTLAHRTCCIVFTCRASITVWCRNWKKNVHSAGFLLNEIKRDMRKPQKLS